MDPRYIAAKKLTEARELALKKMSLANRPATVANSNPARAAMPPRS